MANRNDLRYVRTEQAIRTAFMELVNETPVSSVTASALCRHAHISRNAFYLHHTSIDALHKAMIDELIADVNDQSQASARRVEATGTIDDRLPVEIITALSRHEALLRALLPTDDGSLARCLAEALEDTYVRAALILSSDGDSFEHKMNCAFAAWGHIGFVIRWISETDRPLTESQPQFECYQRGLSESATRFLTSHRTAAADTSAFGDPEATTI